VITHARPTRAAIGLAAAALVAGCGLAREATPAEDALQAWSDHPLAPDAAIAMQALTTHSACLMESPPGQVRILVQDRRTPQTAAFLVASPTMFGSCIVNGGSGGSSGGSGPAPGPMAAAVTIDSIASGGSARAQGRLLGGRVVGQASQVVVALADGRSVVASLNNGYWLAWWPDTTTAVSVEATDAAGAQLAMVQVDQ
jgi:hypothetical protein